MSPDSRPYFFLSSPSASRPDQTRPDPTRSRKTLERAHGPQVTEYRPPPPLFSSLLRIDRSSSTIPARTPVHQKYRPRQVTCFIEPLPSQSLITTQTRPDQTRPDHDRARTPVYYTVQRDLSSLPAGRDSASQRSGHATPDFHPSLYGVRISRAKGGDADPHLLAIFYSYIYQHVG